MYNKYTGQLETHNVIHDYIENENKILNKLTDEKIQRHYIQEIERLKNNWNELEQVIKNYKYTNTCQCYSCNKELCNILLDKIKDLRGEDNE